MSGLRVRGWASLAAAFGLALQGSAAAQDVPFDESVRVAQLTVDAASGNLVSVSLSLQARGPAPNDESGQVAQISVDELTGQLNAGPPSAASAHGAVDHTADANAITVDEVEGSFVSGPANSTAQGAIDHAGDVAAMTVDANTGSFVSGPATSSVLASQGARDHSANVAGITVDAVMGALTASAAQFVFPTAVAPALGLWSALALGALLVVGGWRKVRRPAV
jgi:hypothetical protein